MYKSSIVNKYGDKDKVKQDIKVLNDIIDRQGDALLIDCIAEHAGKTVNMFNLGSVDRKNLIEVLVNELRESLKERL
jgi:hypothetical protein